MSGSFKGELADNNDLNNLENLPKGRPKRGRKRKIPNQSRADRKRLMNNNKQYVNQKGVAVEAKHFDEHFVCSCTKHCTETVSANLRRKLFNQFSSIGSHEGRCAVIVSCVIEIPKRRSYTKSVSKRSITRKYKIFGQEVCKTALLRTLQISESRVIVALKKQENSDTYADGRGKSTGGWNALPLSTKNEVCAHIEAFPRYVSHYCRNKTDAKFLNADLNLAKMYELYKEDRKAPVSFSLYKRIF